MIYKKHIILLIFIFFLSCDKDGTTIVNPPVEDEPFANNLNGNGCSGNNLCYSLDDIYFDFSSSDAFEIDYYKFNSYQLQSGSHDPDDPSNILTLKSFNDSYFIGIPASSIIDGSNQILVIDESGENYEFTQEDITTQILVSEVLQDTTSNLSLSSSPFSLIKNITWNPQQGRYNFVTATSDEYDVDFQYSQSFYNNSYITLIDTVLTPIFGDIILVDDDEYVYRSVTTIDSLSDGSEIRSYRKIQFKIKDTYVPDDDALMFRQSTDCNDNYRKDNEETVIFSNYSKNNTDYANSFEGWCFTGACSDDDNSFNVRDCCENNGGMWYPTSMTCEPRCISYSINCSIYPDEEECQESSKCTWNNNDGFCNSSITEEDCCEHQSDSHEWNSESNECSIEHSYWSERPDEYSWNDSFATFDINDDDLCATLCTITGFDAITMSNYCLGLYDDDERATATCQIDDNDNIYHWNSTSSYDMTFCDRGNNLYTSAEVYVEQNDPPDGFWGENDNQNIEPFEDRNCNSYRDLEETFEDIIANGVWDEGEPYTDSGNGIWDNEEICYYGGDECGYQILFTRSVAPDQLIVNYEDQDNPVSYCEGVDDDGPFDLQILPQGNFFDTGEDGCFDIFETGDPTSPCVCEFDDYHDDIISCEDYLNDLGLLDDSNGDGFVDADLNMDEEVTEFDIALSIHFDEIDFGENPSAYNYGQCINGYSGSKEDCCLHHGCEWSSDVCSLNEPGCLLTDDDYWSENLDPNNDNSTTEFDGLWQEGSEQAKSYVNVDGDLIDIETYYSNELLYSETYDQYVHSADSTVTKILDYNDTFDKGGDKIAIIYNSYEIQEKSAFIPIIKTISIIQSNEIIDQIDFDESEDLSNIPNLEQFYSNILNNHHLVKTEFTNSEGSDDHDYIIFKDTDEHIVKMIHPYYHFLPGWYYPQDMNDFSDDDFWQAIHMESDTLLYSFNGNVIDGQSFHSMKTVYSDTANYNILKEYYVDRASATLKHSVLDPNCVNLEESLCGNDDYYWCSWDSDQSICYSNDVGVISNCLLVTRFITTTAIGPGMSYKLMSESYFKPGFGIVKEDISLYWADLPWVEVPWVPISSIQYKTPASILTTNQSGGLLNYQIIGIEELDNIQDFDFDPYKITNTLGVQRVEFPPGY